MLDGLRGAPTPLIADVLGALGLDAAPLAGMRLIGPGAPRLLGSALTVRYGPAQAPGEFAEAPLLVSDVMEESRPGEVMVLAGGGAALALWGDHMSARALGRDLAGAVIDGMVRDSAGIAAHELPVFALGQTPQSCLGRLDVVARGEPVVCCGREIAPGDAIVGDGDGVLVVPARALPRVADGVAALRDLDGWMDEATAAGSAPRELYREIARRLAGLRAAGEDA